MTDETNTMTEHQSKDDIIQAARALQASYPAEWKIRLGQVIYNNFLSDEERYLVVGTVLDPFHSNEIPHETLDWLMEQRANDRWVRQLEDNNDCQHPLTDEVIHREFLPKFCYTENDLRAAADWQLEQDAEELRTILSRLEMILPHAVDLIVERFKRTMRPLQENN